MNKPDPRSTPDDQQDELAALRDLALRLLRHTGYQEVQREALYMRQLPPDLPVALPLPDAIQLWGSHLIVEKHREDWGAQTIQVLYDCSLSAKYLIDFYHDHLVLAGWEEAQHREGSGVPREPLPDWRSYSLSERRLQLWIMLSATRSDAISVTLRLTQELRPEGYPLDSEEKLLPDLTSPPYVSGGVGGGGQSSQHAYTQGTIESATRAVDLTTLSRYYADQLTQSGWTLIQEVQLDQAIESIWQFRDRNEAKWQGTLAIGRIGGRRQRYLVTVEADRMKSTRGDTRILIVDGLPETRRNLRTFLEFEDEFEVVGLASSGEEAIQKIVEAQPDVALIGFPLPGMDHLEEMEQVRRGSPATSIVVLLAEDAVPSAWASIPQGVKAVLVKPPSADGLIEAVHYAARHRELSAVHLYGLARISTLAQSLSLSEDAVRATISTLEPRGLIRSRIDSGGNTWITMLHRAWSVLDQLFVPGADTGLSDLEAKILRSVSGELFDEVGGAS